MPLRFKYFLYIVALHGLIMWLLYQYFSDNKWLFILSEFGLIMSLIISYIFFKRFNQPLQLMRYGVDAIKDEDYNVRFLKTGSENVNELIDVFNAFLIKLSEERVSAQEQGYFLESIIAASPIAMIMLDYDDRIASFNIKAIEVFGKETLIEESEFFLVSHPLISQLKILQIGESTIVRINPTLRYRCSINSIIHLGFKRKFIMIEELSKELLENEKAAYGKVIRMMAHEVNNSMGAVNSILQSVMDFGFEDQKNEYVEYLRLAKLRNSELGTFMKNFAEVIRLPPPNKQQLDLNDIARRASIIMSQLAKSQDISIQSYLSENPVLIQGDTNQLQQVVINALKNAIESIGQGGMISINVQAAKPQLIIADNGPGISENVKEQLFTPFFSTKPDGQGIGLIISREILVSHGAQFELYTDANIGETKFEISF